MFLLQLSHHHYVKIPIDDWSTEPVLWRGCEYTRAGLTELCLCQIIVTFFWGLVYKVTFFKLLHFICKLLLCWRHEYFRLLFPCHLWDKLRQMIAKHINMGSVFSQCTDTLRNAYVFISVMGLLSGQPLELWPRGQHSLEHALHVDLSSAQA